MNRSRHWILVFALIGTFVPIQAAQNLVAPNHLANSEGNSALVEPFFGGSDGRSFRLQQVYDANQFGGAGDGVYITGFAYRADSLRLPVGGEFARLDWIEIRMSTTSVTPSTLNPVFAVNTGIDNTIVFSAPLEYGFSGSDPSVTPNPFGQKIIIQSSFYYNPKQGDLLLDIYMPRGFTPGVGSDGIMDPSDAEWSDTTPAAIVTAMATGGSTPSSGNVYRAGYVTEFYYIPVPEPATGFLLLIGVVLFVLAADRLKRPSNKQTSPKEEHVTH